ncbi:MAG: hypothetical protein R3293_26320, partial [Candidatus Promineifilaceae bacterium]|nr:hypothetical protein [Candidatus Promineifilaceae bacterium]
MAAKTKTKVKSPPQAVQTPTRETTKTPVQNRLGSAMVGLYSGVGSNGQPPIEDMAGPLAAPQEGPGLLDRARLTEAMQSHIGNTRLNGQTAADQVIPSQTQNGPSPNGRLALEPPVNKEFPIVTSEKPAVNGEAAKTAMTPPVKVPAQPIEAPPKPAEAPAEPVETPAPQPPAVEKIVKE